MSIEEKLALHQQLGEDIAQHFNKKDSVLHRNLFSKIIPIEDCEGNTYNPNVMPKKEMALLRDCIGNYGFLFPCIAYRSLERGKWVIIDGFHRLETLKRAGKKYVSVIDMSHLVESERVQLTVLMNRIKGMHQVELMSNLVVNLTNQGLSDLEICQNLGMEAEEYIRLKQQLGIAAYYSKHPYSKSWEIANE